MFVAMETDKKLKVAILDLYEGEPNEGMRCLRNILREFGEDNNIQVEWNEFDVRLRNDVPDMSYDVFISSGGPGSPLESRYSDWEKKYFGWLNEVERWNMNPANLQKKFVFFICHSFQLSARYYNVGIVTKRRSTAFGVFSVHMLGDGIDEPVFTGLRDPFYAVDSRDFQVIQPNYSVIEKMGAKILCIEKERPHVPYERAIMGIRFNEYMIGTQFHPEADAPGMTMYLHREDKKKTIIENYGEEKWQSMLEHLNDPDKILWTYSHVLPNFLNQAVELLYGELV
ncbi:MAG TPA: GMP synthase [Chitinophagaceae bacterium]|jgi:GMP synthase-like glutamine amidotransferase|nr:GMP synthase [Chitinophagaceae bacterium]